MNSRITHMTAFVGHGIVTGNDNRASASGIGSAIHDEVAGSRTFIRISHAQCSQIIFRSQYIRSGRFIASFHTERIHELGHHGSERVSHAEDIVGEGFAFIAIHNADCDATVGIADSRVEGYRCRQAVGGVHSSIFPSHDERCKAVDNLGGHLLRALVGTEIHQQCVDGDGRNGR